MIFLSTSTLFDPDTACAVSVQSQGFEKGVSDSMKKRKGERLVYA